MINRKRYYTIILGLIIFFSIVALVGMRELKESYAMPQLEEFKAHNSDYLNENNLDQGDSALLSWTEDEWADYIESDREKILESELHIKEIAEMRIWLIGFNVCIILFWAEALMNYIYMNKKTKACYTLKRLPKKGKIVFQLYVRPVLLSLIPLAIKGIWGGIYLFNYINALDYPKLTEAILLNSWRILL